MGSLQQIERLKEMLSEGAEWLRDEDRSVPADGTAPPSSAEHTHSSDPPNYTEKQRSALKDAEKAATLDLQMRCLCAELLRAQKTSVAAGRVALPMLYSIESRLLELDM